MEHICQPDSAQRGVRDRVNWGRLLSVNAIVTVVATILICLFQDRLTAEGVLEIGLICIIFTFTIGTLCGVVLTHFAPVPDHYRFPLGWLALVVVIVCTVAVGTFIASVILLSVGLFHGSNFWKQLGWSTVFSCVLGLTFGLGMFTYEMTRERLRIAQRELQQKQLDEERARKLAAEARLSSLESRIHPHFLFNTLNSIAALIPEDPRRAEEIVQKLAALLRFSLDANQRRLVPLAQEMKTVEDYLAIERTRFGERLRFSLEIPADVEPAGVPPLCLQTLVENAVKYAVAARREGGCVKVTARASAGQLVLEVRDDGPGFNIAEIPAGHGLDNLQERLGALYGDAGRLEVRREGASTAVCLTLPLTQTGAANV